MNLLQETINLRKKIQEEEADIERLESKANEIMAEVEA